MDKEKRREILESLAAGNMTAMEAAQLLSLGEAGEEETEKHPEPGGADPVEEAAAPPVGEPSEIPPVAEVKETAAPSAGQKPSWLRISIEDAASGRKKVSVNLPVKMLRLGLKLGSRFAPALSELDWREIDDLLQQAEPGVLVEVQEHDSGDHVRISFE